MLVAAAVGGAELSIEWRPFVVAGLGPGWKDAAGAQALASFEQVRTTDPAAHGAFLRAVLSLVHDGQRDLSLGTIAAAAEAASVDGPELVAAVRDEGTGFDSVAASHDEAQSRGVTDVPSLARQGPVVLVRTTPADLEEKAIERLQVIDQMMGDDGLWELRKPDADTGAG